MADKQPASVGSFAGRVGHKAGGFISKKFFHPSNFKNQEKLWQAVEAKKEEEKRQAELMKKRDEERRIEQLKSDMYSGPDYKSASGSTSASGGLFTNMSKTVAKDVTALNPQERNAISQTKRRLDMLQAEEKSGSRKSDVRISVKSRFEEDVHEYGHSSVWGSYFDMKSKRWGYSCCQSIEKGVKCTLEGPPSKRL